MTKLRGRTSYAAADSTRGGADNPRRESAAAVRGGAAQTGRESSAPPKVDPAVTGELLYAARSAEQGGDLRLALDYYQRALRTDPGNYLIMNNAAAALNNLKMYREGARQAEKALEKKEDCVPAMINAAIAHSSLGESAEALRFFAAASSADPANSSLAVNLGIYQERSGRLDDALVTYGKPAAAGDLHALEGVARISQRQGNRNEAISAYRRIAANRNASPALKKEVQERLLRLEQ